MHGDELIGIGVVRKLKKMFEKDKLKLEKGRLTLILANVEAIKAGQRATAPEIDLNDLFFKKHLDGPARPYYESRRAKEMAPFLRSADILIDLHATDSGPVPFLPVAFTPKHEKIFRWFDTEIVLTDPTHMLFGRKFLSADEMVDQAGGLGVCFETGWYRNTRRVPIVLESVLKIMADQGLIKLGRPLVRPKKKYQVYEIYRQIYWGKGFRYAKKFAKAKSFDPVKKGEVVAYRRGKPIITTADGVIVLPKTKEHWQDDMKDIFYFAKPVKK
jgi:succinylglutamate desuccinylase